MMETPNRPLYAPAIPVSAEAVEGVTVASYYAWPNRPSWLEILPDWFRLGPLRDAWEWIVRRQSHGEPTDLGVMVVDARAASEATLGALATYANYVSAPSVWVPWMRAWAAQAEVQAILREGLQKAARPDPGTDVAVWTADRLQTVAGWTHPGTSRPITDVALSLTNRWLEATDPTGRAPCRTGWDRVDMVIQGLRAGRLIVVAARPGIGKTTWAANVVRHVAGEDRRPVVWVSCEMSAEEMLISWVAQVAMTNAALLHSGTGIFEPDPVTREVHKPIHAATAAIQRWPLHIEDHGGTLQSIRELVAQMVAQGRCDLLVIDYLQILSRGGLSGKTTNDQLEELTSGLKQLARQYAIPIVLLSQLSREKERRGGHPVLSDLRGSGSIEQDADQVFFLDEGGRPDRRWCGLAKNRHGPSAEWDLKWDPACLRMEDALLMGGAS